VASLSDPEKASMMVKELSISGFPAYMEKTAGKARVFVGPIETRSGADQEVDRLFRERALKGFPLVLRGRDAK
jgi:cell division septation protein DedD